MMKNRTFTLFALVISVAMILLLSPLASSSPDGLETTVHKLGITVADADLPAPLSGYTISGIDGKPSTALAGVAGALLLFSIGSLLSHLLKKKDDN